MVQQAAPISATTPVPTTGTVKAPAAAVKPNATPPNASTLLPVAAYVRPPVVTPQVGGNNAFGANAAVTSYVATQALPATGRKGWFSQPSSIEDASKTEEHASAVDGFPSVASFAGSSPSTAAPTFKPVTFGTQKLPEQANAEATASGEPTATQTTQQQQTRQLTQQQAVQAQTQVKTSPLAKALDLAKSAANGFVNILTGTDPVTSDQLQQFSNHFASSPAAKPLVPAFVDHEDGPKNNPAKQLALGSENFATRRGIFANMGAINLYSQFSGNVPHWQFETAPTAVLSNLSAPEETMTLQVS